MRSATLHPSRPTVRAALLALLAGLLIGPMSSTAFAVDPSVQAFPATPTPEVEPNADAATATALDIGTRARGSVRQGDVDVYRFTAGAGQRVYAAVMTAGTVSASDAVLDLLGSDGTTVVESDDDDGSFGISAPAIAGAAVPTTGTYYLRVTGKSPTTILPPYDLHLDVRGGAPIAEAEPNTLAAPVPLPVAGGEVAGGLSTNTDVDGYSLELQPGDTLRAVLDLDPERDATTFDGRLALRSITTPLLQFLAADPNVTSPNAEALMMTVKTAGTYVLGVDTIGASGGTYALSVSVIPAAHPSCRRYTSVPASAIPTGPGQVTTTINVPDGFTIARAALDLDITHGFMSDIDLSLQTPAGNEIVLLSDIGSSVSGAQPHMDLRIDDLAAIPLGFSGSVDGLMHSPDQGSARMRDLNGEAATGTWTLVVRDDATGDGGVLTSWGLVLCAEDPPPAASETVYASDFETDDGGFTHGGTADEWERGLPAFAPITTCNSGLMCWKTDLDNTYNLSSSQELVSPQIPLTGRSGRIDVTWAQRHQMESVTFDHAWVGVREVGSADVRQLYYWEGATQTSSVGNPPTAVLESSGWAVKRGDLSDYAGKTVELVFHLDSDTTVQHAGLAIDDVRVSQPTALLKVVTAGTGSGFVDSVPAAIDCGQGLAGHAVCESVVKGQISETLTAHPAAGSTFTGFSEGGCSGSATTCTVKLDEPRTVIATFGTAPAGPTPNPTPTPTPTPSAGPSADPQLSCVKSGVLVTDVGRTGQKVRVTGVALPSLAGESVAIVRSRKTVARTTVKPDGSFSVLATLPDAKQRATARFSATIGTRRSAAVRLVRQAIVNLARVRSGKVTLAGTYTGKGRRARLRIELRARTTGCAKEVRIARGRLKGSGTFSISGKAVAGVASAIYRVRVLNNNGKVVSVTLNRTA